METNTPDYFSSRFADSATPVFSDRDKADMLYMKRCLQLAENGRNGARPNPMVGAVLVCDGIIIGEGYHRKCGEAHAEVNCFNSVSPLCEPLIQRSTLYVSLEPCSHYGRTPPCADLIVNKKVHRVVVGCVDSFAEVSGRGIRKLLDAGIEVTVGVLEDECRRLNKRFFTFNTLHRPFITLKWAQTINGFIDSDGRPLAISNPFTLMLSHKLRAESDAILVGRVTEEREHPKLNVRHWSGKDPVKMVLDSSTSTDGIIARCCENNLQSLIVEGGATTLKSFMDADLWDEIRVETAPIIVESGTKAPALPAGIRIQKRDVYDGNEITIYERLPL